MFSSCSFIPHAHFETNLVMVSYYDCKIWRGSRWSSHFWVKMRVFKPLSTIKVNLVDKMIQSTYFCVILHVKREKLPVLVVFPWFLILGKIQDGGQDGDHVCWRHRSPAAPPPIKYISSCWEDQRLSIEGKIVSKYCDASKTLRRGSINSPLVRRWGYEFACTLEG